MVRDLMAALFFMLPVAIFFVWILWLFYDIQRQLDELKTLDDYEDDVAKLRRYARELEEKP